ncbi:MAG: hypothetical protein ACTSXP_06200 [Promethearchaeota archaeon]
MVNEEIKIVFDGLDIKKDGSISIVRFPPLNDEQREILDPIVPPTSGFRIKLLEKSDDKYFCPAENYCMFLRIFKAISITLLEKLGRPAKILLTSDERPTADVLLKDACRILYFDKHKIHVQSKEEKSMQLTEFQHSGLSTPYSSASVSIFPDLDAVLCLTASHNSIVWNGVKFYYRNPIPIAGDLIKKISKKAIDLEDVKLANEDSVILQGKDHRTIINEYIKRLIQDLISIRSIKGTPVVLWPYMGPASGIYQLLKDLGVNVRRIEKSMEPPDPTVNFPTEEIKNYLDEHNSKLAIMLDADRDRIVFLVKIDDQYLKLNPNELYTAMHNILVSEFDKNIINIRTVPSDPRCDDKSKCTIETGVGYKHLGIVQFVACDREIDPSQFKSALIYGKSDGKRIKLDTQEKIFEFIEHNIETDPEKHYIMALWEESGGHTFNILKPIFDGKKLIRFESKFPLIGDKFPAPAIITLTEIIARGYKLIEWIDTTIIGKRIKIEADDQHKKQIMDKLKSHIGKELKINQRIYQVSGYRDNDGKLDIIGLFRAGTTIYVRPSGTGNSIRIYIFGDRNTSDQEIQDIGRFVKSLNPN